MKKLIDTSIMDFISDFTTITEKKTGKKPANPAKEKKTKDVVKEKKNVDNIPTEFNSFLNIINTSHPDIKNLVTTKNIKKVINKIDYIIIVLKTGFRVEITNLSDNRKHYKVFAEKNIKDSYDNIVVHKGVKFLDITDDSRTRRMAEILKLLPASTPNNHYPIHGVFDTSCDFFENKKRAIFIGKGKKLRLNKIGNYVTVDYHYYTKHRENLDETFDAIISL